MNIARVLTAAAVATAFAVTTASAQQPQVVPVIGQIQGVDANLLVVKTQAGEQKVALANHVVVWGLEKASVSDVTKGAFVGCVVEVHVLQCGRKFCNCLRELSTGDTLARNRRRP